MSARDQAAESLGGRYAVAVLEPSPPTVTVAPWFADDPVVIGATTLPAVTPILGAGGETWQELVDRGEVSADWAAERWLAAYPRLTLPPPTLTHTRDALHRLAIHVISPTRKRANGKIGLRWTRGGFGTPFFGNDVQVRVAADVLTVVVGAREHRGRLTTLRDAAEFVGFDLTRQDAAADDGRLQVDPAASHWLGELFGFATSVLEQLRAEAPPSAGASRVQLWPEHFDVAVEIGDDAASGRAAFGVSPGDEEHPMPYLYVSPWASQGYEHMELEALLGAADQREAALAFFRAWLGR